MPKRQLFAHPRVITIIISFVILGSFTACQVAIVPAASNLPLTGPRANWTPIPVASPIPDAAPSFLDAGDNALLQSDIPTAISSYQSAIPLMAYPGPAYARLAYAYAQNPAQWQLALATAQKAVDLSREDAEVWGYHALTLATLHHNADALVAARQARALKRNHPLSYHALAQAYLTDNRIPEALTAVEAILARQPDHVQALVIQSHCFTKLNRVEEALAAAERASRLAPAYVPAAIALAQARAAAWEYPEAHIALTQILHQHPQSIHALLAQANLHRQQNNIDGMTDAITHANAIAPDTPAVQNALGQWLLAQGQAQRALPHFEQALDLDPDFALAHSGLGQARYAIGECLGAIATLQHALTLAPNLADSHLALARSLTCVKDSRSAADHYAQAHTLAYGDVPIHQAYADYLIQQDKHTAAITSYRAMLMRLPDTPQLYTDLGYNYLHSLGNQKNAEGNFIQTLRLAPQNPDVLVELGSIYNTQGRYEQAIIMFQRALAIIPDITRAYCGLTQAYAHLQNHEQTIIYGEKVLALHPTHAATHRYLGWAYRQTGRDEQAGQALLTYLEYNEAPIATGAIIHNTAYALANKRYWLPEHDLNRPLNTLLTTTLQSTADTVPLTLVATHITGTRQQRALDVTLQFPDQLPSNAVQRTSIALAAASSAALSPRILPPVELGTYIHALNQAGDEIFTGYIAPDLAYAIADGVLQDPVAISQKITVYTQNWDIPSPANPETRGQQAHPVAHPAQVRSAQLLGFSTTSTQTGGLYEETPAPASQLPMPTTLFQLDPAWQQVSDSMMGLHFIQAYLNAHIAPDVADIAVQGWQADRQLLFRHKADDRALLIWQTVWHSADEAREFVVAQRLAYGQHTAYEEVQRSLRSGQRILHWQSDERHIEVRQDGMVVWLLIAEQSEDIATIRDLVAP